MDTDTAVLVLTAVMTVFSAIQTAVLLQDRPQRSNRKADKPKRHRTGAHKRKGKRK